MEGDYRMVIRRGRNHHSREEDRDRGEAVVGDRQNPASFTLCFWCLNPAVAFAKLASSARSSIILTSDTLSPLDSFASELGLKFQCASRGTTRDRSCTGARTGCFYGPQWPSTPMHVQTLRRRLFPGRIGVHHPANLLCHTSRSPPLLRFLRSVSQGFLPLLAQMRDCGANCWKHKLVL